MTGPPPAPRHKSQGDARRAALAMIGANCSPSIMKSVDQSVKLPNSGGSVAAESVVIEVDRHTTSISNPSGSGEARVAHASSQCAGTPKKVNTHGSADRTEDHVDSRAEIQALEGGGGSPGLFGAAMMLLRGSTKLRSATDDCTATGLGETAPLTKSVSAVDAITPDESNGGSDFDGCLHRDGQDDPEKRRGRSLRAASGPYQHALFTAPDSLQEQESDRLPLVTINVSSHAGLPSKRRLRTKHVVTYKKRKVIQSHPSGASTAPSVQTGRTKSGGGTQEKANSSAKAGLVPTADAGGASKGEVVQRREPLRPSHAGLCPKTETYGITKRLSDNYQAQVFFARKSRYIGVFPTPEIAAFAVSEVKKELSKYKKPFEGDGDVAFRKARDVALKAVGKAVSSKDLSKISQCSTFTRPDATATDSERNATSNNRLDEKRKPKEKGNGAQPSSRSATNSKCETDSSLSLLLLAAAADAEKDRCNSDTKKKVTGTKTSKAASGKVDLAETKEDATVGNENVSSLSKQQNVQPTGDRKSTSHRHSQATWLSRADPRCRVPGTRPSSTTQSLSESRSFPPVPPEESFQYICSKRVYSSREVFITVDKENRFYEVHVSDDNLLPDPVISLGPTTKKEKARKLFEIVCSIAYHAGEKYWCMLPDLVGALDLNKRMVPHMPPPLVRGYLGIAFVVETLDWHVYGYLKDKSEPGLIGKYRVFVDAVFAYNTAARMQRYPALLEEHRTVALKVKDEVLANVAATRPQCNVQREHQIRFSLSNIRCMLAHGLSSGRRSSASGSSSVTKPQSTVSSMK